MRRVERLLLTLRVLLEVAVVAALAYWGVHTGGEATAKILLGIGAPAAGFGFWGSVDFRQAGRFAEPLRLFQELAISCLAVLAWYESGRVELAIALAAFSVGYHVLVYATGARLLDASTKLNAEGT